VSVADLASLEFGYFRLLQHNREPHAPNQALASDPALFVDLVRRTFRGANEPRRQSKSSDPLTIGSGNLENGVINGRLNSRGITWVALMRAAVRSERWLSSTSCGV
jgi:hypothetical protein